MPLPVFEHAYLLQSLGWAIANSFWQIGCLWLLYQCITKTDKKLPALVKYQLSVVLLITSFVWFIYTIQQNYSVLVTANASPEIFMNELWIENLRPINNTLPLISIVYLVLLGYYSLRFLKNLSGNRFLQKKGLTKAPVDIRLFITRTALHLGIKKKIQVWLSAYVDVPSVTGFIKPVILLPAAIINQLTIQQTEAILLHELAHIKRNDYLVNFLQSVIELIMFFNPFAILLSKAAKKERENCCDDWVINFQYDHRDYARALLVLEEQRHLLQFRFALAATNGKKNLLHRIKRLFNAEPQINFSFLQKIKFICLCILLLAGMYTILPYMINKPANTSKNTINFSNKKEKLNFVKIDKHPKEVTLKNTFTTQPVRSTNANRPLATNKKTKKQAPREPVPDYVNAFINEDLLNPASPVEPIISQVVEKEINNSKYLIKIEEQQSGKNQTNTYYFELKNNNGNADIKPLMMLNKVKAQLIKVAPLGNLPDSLKAIANPVLVKKRRITT